MRTLVALGVLSMAVSACSPTSYSAFSKSGVSSNIASRDDTACSVEANRLFPAANFTTTVYGGYGGGYPGYWGGYPGYWGGGHVQVRDVNASMRAEHRRDCMALKGYRPATHPVCTEAQLAGRSYQPINGAPPPAAHICAVSAQGGGVALLDLSEPL